MVASFFCPMGSALLCLTPNKRLASRSYALDQSPCLPLHHVLPFILSLFALNAQGQIESLLQGFPWKPRIRIREKEW